MKNPTRPAALIYTRYSPRPTKRKNGRSDTSEPTIAIQMQRCLAYCELAGLHVAAVLQESHVSGTLPLDERPLGCELERRLAEGDATHVVVQKIDRLYRDLPEGVWKLRQWQQAGITLHLADEGGNAINTGTAVGELMVAQLLSIAQFNQRVTVERTRENMAWRQQQGQRMGSRPPFGYRVDPLDPDRLIEDEIEQQAINRIHALRAARPQMGLRAIGRQLEAEGLPCRGQQWHHGTIKKILQSESCASVNN